jgi:hypothetical protein
MALRLRFLSDVAVRITNSSGSAGARSASAAENQPGTRPVSIASGKTAQRLISSAVRAVLRGQPVEEIPAHGINVMFDGGVLAVCRTCHISWEVSRRHFTNLAWWSCPHGCSAAPRETASGSDCPHSLSQDRSAAGT